MTTDREKLAKHSKKLGTAAFTAWNTAHLMSIAGLRWRFSRQYAYRLIAFAGACQLEVDTAKLTEGQFHRTKTAKKDVSKRKAGEAPKPIKSPLELERKLVISVEQEFDSFGRFLTRLDGGLSTEDYLQLLAQMRDQLDKAYHAKQRESGETSAAWTSSELEEVAA